jgi:hypothetical protein
MRLNTYTHFAQKKKTRLINKKQNTMKKLITICLLLATAFSVNAQAQNAPLNKQQTVDYIEKLFKAAFKQGAFKVNSVTLDGKILHATFSDGNINRTDLSEDNLLVILGPKSDGYHIKFSPENEKMIFCCIQLEADAKRLKKALEHLIEILKTEKSTDPFGE